MAAPGCEDPPGRIIHLIAIGKRQPRPGAGVGMDAALRPTSPSRVCLDGRTPGRLVGWGLSTSTGEQIPQSAPRIRCFTTSSSVK
jgi:hypothetical protein